MDKKRKNRDIFLGFISPNVNRNDWNLKEMDLRLNFKKISQGFLP